MKSLLAVLCFFALTLDPAAAQSEGVGGLVSGKVQKVGFRAFVLKQAIAQNLAGWTVNMPDGRVSFVLYGKAEGISQALKKIAKGPDRSEVSQVQTWNVAPQKRLNTFTVYAWTSETRNLHVPRDLVFQKRSDGSILKEDDAKKVYHEILKASGVDE